MTKKVLLLFVFIFAFSSLVSAHGTAFFEFAPRVSSRLTVSTVATPSQIFRPQNDFLSGFDFWVDNDGDPETVLFELFDSEENLLRSRSVTVPTISKIPGGQRFHIDFLSQMPISNLEDYHIKVTTSMPDFSIYHSNRLLLLQHTNETVSEYDFGAVQLGDVLQDYTFKSAFYETEEDAPPVVSNLSATILSFSMVRVDFNANEAVDFKVEYGPQAQGYVSSTQFTDTYTICGEGIALCSTDLNVFPDTAYVYRVIVRDGWGNEAEATGIFQSAATPPSSDPFSPSEDPQELVVEEDVVAPSISNARIVSVTENSVRVAWTTDEVANSYLSVTLSGVPIASVSDLVLELEHLLQTSSILQSDTEYRATISSRDRFDNIASDVLAFTTSGASVSESPQEEPQEEPPPPPEPEEPESDVPLSPDQPTEESPVLVIVETGSGDEDEPENTVTVRWITPGGGIPSDGYRVDLFDANFKLQIQSSVESNINELQFTDLAPGDYYVVVYANDGGVFERIGKVIKFTVKRANRGLFYSVWFYVFIVGFVGVLIILLKIDERRREQEWRI